jgi:hypothetical protein
MKLFGFSVESTLKEMKFHYMADRQPTHQIFNDSIESLKILHRIFFEDGSTCPEIEIVIASDTTFLKPFFFVKKSKQCCVSQESLDDIPNAEVEKVLSSNSAFSDL